MTFSNIAGQLYIFNTVLTPLVIVTIYVLGIITVIFPIAKSVRFANKVSPVETIRNVSRSDDKLVYKQVPKHVEKVLKTSGLLAVKNYHRDRKKHRSTAISLIITIILFITITSFVDYAKSVVGTAEGAKYDVEVRNCMTTKESRELINDIASKIEKEYGKESLVNYKAAQLHFTSDNNNSKFTSPYSVSPQLSEYDFYEIYVENTVVMLNDEDFSYYFGKENLHKTVFKNTVQGELTISYGSPRKSIYVDSVLADVNAGDHFDYQFFEYANGEVAHELKRTISLDIIKEKLPFEIATNEKYSGMRLVLRESKVKALDLYEYFYETDGYTSSSEIVVTSPLHTDIEKRINEVISTDQDVNESNHGIYVYNKTSGNLLLSSIFGSVDIATKIITGFIVIICISNLLNVLTSSSRQRSKEYGVYRSVGMDVKSLRNMIFYETVINSWKPLIFGIVSGILLSFGMYIVLDGAITLNNFSISWTAVGQAVVMVIIVQMVQLVSSMQLLKRSNIVQDLKRMEM